MTSLWLNADSEDEFNAGTVLGYSSEDWLSIKNYSGLWRVDGRIKPEVIWMTKLDVTVIHRTMGHNKIKWFCFGDKISDQRVSRLNTGACDPLGNSVPGDDTSLRRIREFYSNMESRIGHVFRESREIRFEN